MEDEACVASKSQARSPKVDDDDDDDQQLFSLASSSVSEPFLVFQDTKSPPLHRCKTAPAMAAMVDDSSSDSKTAPPPPQSESSGWVVKQTFWLLVVYLSCGVAVYSLNTDHFSGAETNPVVDALYFCIVTMCTIGYGDIAPLTPFTKIFACVFVLVGFGFIDILLSGVVNYVLDLQEGMILSAAAAASHRRRGPSSSLSAVVVDAAKGRMRIRLKVGLALAVVVLCVGVGALFLRLVEGLDWVDSVYLATMSVTTVGYGDKAFSTAGGRVFAAAWLLVSTLAVARAFLYLAEARVDSRHRQLANWALQRDITVHDLLAADINNNNGGFICKSEYVIYKLKEMGKIDEKDINQICDQFSKLDPNNSAKITLPHLFHQDLS